MNTDALCLSPSLCQAMMTENTGPSTPVNSPNTEPASDSQISISTSNQHPKPKPNAPSTATPQTEEQRERLARRIAEALASLRSRLWPQSRI